MGGGGGGKGGLTPWEIWSCNGPFKGIWDESVEWSSEWVPLKCALQRNTRTAAGRGDTRHVVDTETKSHEWGVRGGRKSTDRRRSYEPSCDGSTGKVSVSGESRLEGGDTTKSQGKAAVRGFRKVQRCLQCRWRWAECNVEAGVRWRDAAAAAGCLERCRKFWLKSDFSLTDGFTVATVPRSCERLAHLFLGVLFLDKTVLTARACRIYETDIESIFEPRQKTTATHVRLPLPHMHIFMRLWRNRDGP